jgi:beta-lactamase superfamily II metal-dependent hydrolase
MRRLVSAFFCVVLFVAAGAAKAKPKSLRIYFLDTEGGQATLVATPSGQALLFDTGWPGDRDADRIVAAAKDARVKQLDFVVITHFHGDHVGGVADLADKMKIGTFVDHGPTMEDSDHSRTVYVAYQRVAAKLKRQTVKPGEGLNMKDITVKILTAAGEHIADPLAGAGTANAYCDGFPKPESDPSENARSVGTLVTFGKFRFLDMGDLSQTQELELACPNNMVGTTDLYLVTHHGADGSNAKPWVWSLHPRVAVMENGAKKGGEPATWQVVHDSPGLEGLYQLHYSPVGGAEHNVAEGAIANLDEKDDKGNFIKVTAEKDGSFRVLNSRTGETKSYPRK